MAESRLATESSRPPQHQDWKRLRTADSYRSFLKVYLEEKSLSLSDFARFSGFGRGFPGDVLSGKRRLTTKSAFAFEQALRVPSRARKLFRLLVARDEPDVFPEIERENVLTAIEELRWKNWGSSRRKIQEGATPQIPAVFDDPMAILVYAASGQPETGATPAEIAGRAGLSVNEATRVALRLQDASLLKFESKSGRFIPQDLHLFVQAGDRSEFFVRLFRQACSRAASRVETGLASDKEFFFASALTVSTSRLPELKQALREVALKFVDESIEPEGDTVVSMTVAFHANS